jgi:hypothetical protein
MSSDLTDKYKERKGREDFDIPNGIKVQVTGFRGQKGEIETITAERATQK